MPQLRKLRRVRMGPLQLKGLQAGQWRELTPKELSLLRDQAFATPQQRAARRAQLQRSGGAAALCPPDTSCGVYFQPAMPPPLFARAHTVALWTPAPTLAATL